VLKAVDGLKPEEIAGGTRISAVFLLACDEEISPVFHDENSRTHRHV